MNFLVLLLVIAVSALLAKSFGVTVAVVFLMSASIGSIISLVLEER